MTDHQPPGSGPEGGEPPGSSTGAVHAADVDTLRHLRVLEERFMNLRRKAQLSDEKLLAAEQKLQSEIKLVSSEITEARRQLAELRDSVAVLQAEVGHAASMHDVKAIEKYLSFWEPMEFVTQTELSRRQNLLNAKKGR